MSLQQGRISYRVAGGRRRIAPHLFLCHYCPRDYGPDELSSSLLRFKAGLGPDSDAWTAYALEALRKRGFSPGVLVVRALHHQETFLTGREGSSLDVLAAGIARRFGGRYAPLLLGKRRVTRTCRELPTKAERIAELRGVYYWRGRTDLGRWGQKVLILDDIVTTGATTSAILAVVHEALPEASLLVYSLARASPDRLFNQALMRTGL